MLKTRFSRFTAGAIAMLSAAVCCSCTAMKPEHGAASEGLVPDNFGAAGQGGKYPDRWWLDFESRELARLVDEAMSGNFSLATAEARFRQAAALAKKSGAGLVPEVSLTGGAGVTRAHSSEIAGQDGAADEQTRTVEEYSLGLAASYELDLWGRVRSSRRSALESSGASRYDLATAAMTLAAQVADQWLGLVEQGAQLGLLKQQLQTNRAQLELIELRRRKGLATALDVYQQKQAVAATEALIPLAEGALESSSNGLAVLLGRPPGSDIGISEAFLPEMPAAPATGLPVEVLARRPDVQAAWSRLESAGWDIAAARAERLPAIRLTGSTVYHSEDFKAIFENWIMNLAAGLTAPVVDGARRRAEVERVEAVRDERMAQYRQAVLIALREVEDALSREQRQTEHLLSLEEQAHYAASASEEALRAYSRGRSDYLRVLVATESAQRLDRQVLQARRERLSARIGLYRALGGSWMMEDK